jgi:hypothetical protein
MLIVPCNVRMGGKRHGMRAFVYQRNYKHQCLCSETFHTLKCFTTFTKVEPHLEVPVAALEAAVGCVEGGNQGGHNLSSMPRSHPKKDLYNRTVQDLKGNIIELDTSE